MSKDLASGEANTDAILVAAKDALVFTERTKIATTVVEGHPDFYKELFHYEFVDKAHLEKHAYAEYITGVPFCLECTGQDTVVGEKVSAQQKLRAEAMELLGNFCMHCTETDRRVLQIDHIFGDGAKQRREMNTYQFLKDVLEHGATRYQVLCANCNVRKRVVNDERSK